MSYLNKNLSLNYLKDIVDNNINIKTSFLPDEFKKEQIQALEVFKKRVFLEEIIEETISFNKKLLWDNKNTNTSLVGNAEELIEVFKLRSTVYKEISYQKECPDVISGLNFDIFDKNSAVIFCKNNSTVSGTIRLIFDSKEGLPSEEKYSFFKQRENFGLIAEISRNIVKTRNKGLNLEFKYLMCGIYNIMKNNNVNLALSGIRSDHLKLFEKLGGVQVEKELDSYGNVNIPFFIISYNPNEASKFFKRIFLNKTSSVTRM